MVTAPEQRLREEFGPFLRLLAARYFEPVRFSEESAAELSRLHAEGFVVHVMRTTAWVNFLYLTWALIRRGLPPVRAVVNLRRWFTRPWRRTAQRGAPDVRFTYARRQGGSALVFLKRSAMGRARGRAAREDPFPELVALARRGERNVFLVPELFVWEKWNLRLRPGVIDFLFGSPEAPGFLHTVLAFWRNYDRAQLRVGEPIDLKRFIADHPGDSDAVIARKVRGVLHQHLARETRAVFGPPIKSPDRLIEETLRDRVLRRTLEEIAADTRRPLSGIEREAKRHLKAIAARPHNTVIALFAPLMGWVFDRIYDGIEVDEAGLERAMRAAARAPIVLVPSHKSHVDYLVLSYVLWRRGYAVPLIAAGANLSFWPLGPLLRRGGAFFLRRTFRGARVYTAAFRAYVKKLVHDGAHQEFFPEGGRSRTGKLLPPKLGLFTWEVEAVLEGARDDLVFVPVAIDYEQVVESSTYSQELAGGEKRPESLKSLLSTPKVLRSRYGRIHLAFDEPISLRGFAAGRGFPLGPDAPKQALVRALGHRVMYGIARISTVTPHALTAAALLPGGGEVTARQLAERIGLIRAIAESDGARRSRALENAPSDPTVFGPIADALRTFCSAGIVHTDARGDAILYRVASERRLELLFPKNTLMNLLASRCIVAASLLGGGAARSGPLPLGTVRERALWLSRLMKLEFVYQVGIRFEALFDQATNDLERRGLCIRTPDAIELAPEPHARPQLEFLAELLRDLVEAYWVAARILPTAARPEALDRKQLVRSALERARQELQAGRIACPEALSRTTFENAVAYFLEQGFLIEADGRLRAGPRAQDAGARDPLAKTIAGYLLPAR